MQQENVSLRESLAADLERARWVQINCTNRTNTSLGSFRNESKIRIQLTRRRYERIVIIFSSNVISMQIQDLTIQNEKLKSRVKLAEKMAEQHNRSERESKEALQVCDSF